ncbi:MAG TPA: anti-sigma factor [Opitutaceae bacterium]|nr:anti-sigma factor [Opitutaceae bacterium]
MIDERHEELAALYAFDLLEGLEKTAFETAMTRDPELQALVRELRESSAALAHAAPAATPPPELKTRLLSEIHRPSYRRRRSKVVAFPQWVPWAIAASIALMAVWTGQLYLTGRSEAAALRSQQALADITLKNLQTQLEAERIISTQQLTGLNQQATDTARQLAEARQSAATAERLLADAVQQSGDLERLLASARTELADLGQQLKTQGDVANLKITTLASMLNNTPQALAVAVWNPANQEGMLKTAKLPALAADRDYQLWVVDPQYADPVDGGTFTVDPKTGEANVRFKTKQPIKAIKAYAITAERKGGVMKSEGPFLLLGAESETAP